MFVLFVCSVVTADYPVLPQTLGTGAHGRLSASPGFRPHSLATLSRSLSLLALAALNEFYGPWPQAPFSLCCTLSLTVLICDEM